MAASVLYVYAITRDAISPHGEAVDGSANFQSIARSGVAAVCTPVSDEQFSQEGIDRRAGDLEWLGAIGYRHQAIVADLMKHTAIIPLRAFTLFRSEESVASYLEENHAALRKMLDRLDGKQEWTVRIEFEPERWREALGARVPSLSSLQGEIETAGAGKAFLLKKKLDEERKKASRTAEKQLVEEVERELCTRMRCDSIAETREQREGAFPQINLLINRDEDATLGGLHAELSDRYAPEGVTLSLTGPWPPYTFAHV